MGSCEGFQVEGTLRTVSTGARQVVLELKPITNLWKELCSFCSEQCETSFPNSKIVKHSHSLEGIFSLNANKMTFVLTDCGMSSGISPVHQNQNHLCLTSQDDKRNDYNPQSKPAEALQYQVDGKVYKIPTNVNQTKESKHIHTQPKSSNESSHTKDHINPSISNKNIEFVIENNKYTASDLGLISGVSQQPVVEVPPSQSSSAKKSKIEASLKILQVKLKENSIIPEEIICGPDTSTFLQNMRELAKLIAPNGPNVFKCEQCEEEMTSYFPYIEHIFKHFGTRPYICNVCQASFQTRAVMRHHLDMHGGKAPFECEFCGKKFRNSCHMKQHRMRHTGERPHNCPYCEKTFAHKNVLKIHLQVHTGEKPCCCDLCGKLFRERHRLACHLATHYKSEKSLECATCGKSFKSVGMLKLHESKKCSKTHANTDINLEDSNLDSLQNVSFNRSLDDTTLINADHEVTIIEAETLEVLPVNTYIVEPSGVGAMLVQFSIDHDAAQEIDSLQIQNENS